MENIQLEKINILKSGLLVLSEYYIGLRAKASKKTAFNPQKDKLLYNAYLVKKLMKQMVKNYSTKELTDLNFAINEENNFCINEAYFYAAKLNVAKSAQSRKKSYILKTVLGVTNYELQARDQAHKEAQEFAK